MKKVTKVMLYINVGAFGLLVLVLVFVALIPDVEEEGEGEKVAEEDQDITDRLGTDWNAWNGSYRPLIEFIKENMNDPGSFEHVETRLVEGDDGKELYVRMKFRGTNAYGGTVTQEVQALADIDSGEIIQAEMVE